MKIFSNAFCDSTKSLRLVLITMYALIACGMYMQPVALFSGLALMFKLLHLAWWEFFCFVLLFSRSIELFGSFTYASMRKATAILGILFWSFLFSSSFEAFPFGLGMIYLAPALIETLILARVCYEHTLGVE